MVTYPCGRLGSGSGCRGSECRWLAGSDCGLCICTASACLSWRGAGRFWEKLFSGGASNPFNVRAVDLNRDGRPDLVLSEGSAAKISVPPQYHASSHDVVSAFMSRALWSLPMLWCGAMHISSSFDSGNIEVIDDKDPSAVRLRIRKDAGEDHFQWFHFSRHCGARKAPRAADRKRRRGKLSEGFENYRACVSYDRVHFGRVDTTFDGRC